MCFYRSIEYIPIKRELTSHKYICNPVRDLDFCLYVCVVCGVFLLSSLEIEATLLIRMHTQSSHSITLRSFGSSKFQPTQQRRMFTRSFKTKVSLASAGSTRSLRIHHDKGSFTTAEKKSFVSSMHRRHFTAEQSTLEEKKCKEHFVVRPRGVKENTITNFKRSCDNMDGDGIRDTQKTINTRGCRQPLLGPDREWSLSVTLQMQAEEIKYLELPVS